MADPSPYVAGGRDLRSIALSRTIPASPTALFDAFTTSEGIAAFLGVESWIELRPGGAYELYFAPNGPQGERGSDGCVVLAYVPDRVLAFSWNAPPQFPAERGKRTWVVLTFDPTEGGATCVTLTHLGFGEDGYWDDVVAYFQGAWSYVLDRLEEASGG